MARRRVSPEAQMIALFTGLSDEGKKIVMFGLNAIMSNEGPKPSVSAAPGMGRKLSRHRAVAVPVVPNTEGDSEKAFSVSSSDPICGTCGNPEEHTDHDATYLSSHKFEAPKVKKAKSA